MKILKTGELTVARVEDPIYYTTNYIYVTDDYDLVFPDLKKRLNLDDDSWKPDIAGYASTNSLILGNGIVNLVCVPKTGSLTRLRATLVHEIYHMTLMTFAMIGSKVSTDDQEPSAYLLKYYCEEILQLFEKDVFKYV